MYVHSLQSTNGPHLVLLHSLDASDEPQGPLQRLKPLSVGMTMHWRRCEVRVSSTQAVMSVQLTFTCESHVLGGRRQCFAQRHFIFSKFLAHSIFNLLRSLNSEPQPSSAAPHHPPEMAESKVVNVDVDPDGEVILVCGYTPKSSNAGQIKGGEPDQTVAGTMKIRVRALILTLNSPVFRALLSPRFREGSHLAANATVEIALPEDNGNAMKILCQVLHLRNNNVPRRLRLEELLATAKLADKYDVVEGAKHAADGWMSKFEPPQWVFKSSKWASALVECAYYFDNFQFFHDFSYDLVMQSKQAIQSSEASEVPTEIEEFISTLHCLTC